MILKLLTSLHKHPLIHQSFTFALYIMDYIYGLV